MLPLRLCFKECVDVGKYPLFVLQHVQLVHIDPRMNPPVTDDAKSHQIPRFTVPLVQVEVMNSQQPLLPVPRMIAEQVTARYLMSVVGPSVEGFVVRMAAPYASVVGSLFDC